MALLTHTIYCNFIFDEINVGIIFGEHQNIYIFLAIRRIKFTGPKLFVVLNKMFHT